MQGKRKGEIVDGKGRYRAQDSRTDNQPRLGSTEFMMCSVEMSEGNNHLKWVSVKYFAILIAKLLYNLPFYIHSVVFYLKGYEFTLAQFPCYLDNQDFKKDVVHYHNSLLFTQKIAEEQQQQKRCFLHYAV